MQHRALGIILKRCFPPELRFKLNPQPVGCITEIAEGFCHMGTNERQRGNVCSRVYHVLLEKDTQHDFVAVDVTQPLVNCGAFPHVSQ